MGTRCKQEWVCGGYGGYFLGRFRFFGGYLVGIWRVFAGYLVGY